MACGNILVANAQLLTRVAGFSRADTLRGSLNANRTWWDVRRYDVSVRPNFLEKTISGHTKIMFDSRGGAVMQIDLQQPLVVDSVKLGLQLVKFERQNHLLLVQAAGKGQGGQLGTGRFELTVYYHGAPKIAQHPPWDGGWIFATDPAGHPWMTVACQGLGASVWYPCKDHQSDEPDDGASLTVAVPEGLTVVANGKLVQKETKNGVATFRWEVKNPINTYNLVPYIGRYANFSETYAGEEGNLSCNYWVLEGNTAKARRQFTQTADMLKCFEHWFGPYPFYEDGYQLVEAPHLGMEHQSAIAYGNGFGNGYRGRDLSGSGWGSKWDYILVHESGHEWFGNNITTNDIADMWVHEGFTNYSEVLYTECRYGKAAGSAYLRGLRHNIKNDNPVVGPYGVNKAGSGDMYAKGANLLHTLRTSLNNDSLFRQMLRGLNRDFYHKMVTSAQIENYISQFTGMNLAPLFDQYLRTTQVPEVHYMVQGHTLGATLANCVPGFGLKLWMPTGKHKGEWQWIQQGRWTEIKCQLTADQVEDAWLRDYYVTYIQVAQNPDM
jgi:aminopeptidase N